MWRSRRGWTAGAVVLGSVVVGCGANTSVEIGHGSDVSEPRSPQQSSPPEAMRDAPTPALEARPLEPSNDEPNEPLPAQLTEVDLGLEHSAAWSPWQVVATLGKSWESTHAVHFQAAGLAGGKATALWNDYQGKLTRAVYQQGAWLTAPLADLGTPQAAWLNPDGGDNGVALWSDDDERLMVSEVHGTHWSSAAALALGWQMAQPFPTVPAAKASVAWSARGDRAIAWTDTQHWISGTQGWQELTAPVPLWAVSHRAVSTDRYVLLSAPNIGGGEPNLSEWTNDLGWQASKGTTPALSPDGAQLLWVQEEPSNQLVASLRTGEDWVSAELNVPGVVGAVTRQHPATWATTSNTAAVTWSQCETNNSGRGGCGSQLMLAVWDGASWHSTAVTDSDMEPVYCGQVYDGQVAISQDGAAVYVAAPCGDATLVSKWSAPFSSSDLQRYQVGVSGELQLLTNESGDHALILSVAPHPETGEDLLVASSYPTAAD